MLSKSAARRFFLGGTAVCFGAFVLLTVDSLSRIPAQTHADQLTPAAIRGKHLWESSNCMGCHTILGEGAYYAPELTQVYHRRGPAFIEAMLRDPAAMYPGRRRMQKYDFDAEQIQDLIAFLRWIGGMDLNGFPPQPDLSRTAVSSGGVAAQGDRPLVFNQMCIACHTLAGQGGTIGPALDGVGDRVVAADIEKRLRDPKSVKPDSLMPKLPLTESDITELVAFLSNLKSRGEGR